MEVGYFIVDCCHFGVLGVSKHLDAHKAVVPGRSRFLIESTAKYQINIAVTQCTKTNRGP